jgi:membrane fusion protein
MRFVVRDASTHDRRMTRAQQESIFRQQAIAALSKRMPGRPICVAPRPWLWLNALILLIVLCLAVFLSQASFTRKEVSRGWLLADRGTIRVSSRTPASVSRVFRKVGDPVKAGDPLITLTRDNRMSDGASRSETLLGHLFDETAEVETQMDALLQQLESQTSGLQPQLADVAKAAVALQSRRDEQQRRIDLNRQKLKQLDQAGLSGAVSEWDISQQREKLVTLSQALDAIDQEIAEQRRDQTRLRGEIASLSGEVQIRQSALRTRRLQLAQQIAEHEVQRQMTLTSPVNGVVASVSVHPGYPVVAHELLATVLPANSELVADIFVPSRAAGYIRVGQRVQLAYDAFPHQQYGTFGGHVEHIVEHVLLPGEIPQTFPIREATYRVRVSIDESDIGAQFGAARLRPGMLLSADLLLETRSLLAWLLDPLRSQFRRST